MIAPTTVEEIVEAVRTHEGPIAIGGGRYSMGGQTAAPGALQIDMRRFNRILALDTAARTITVQAGARWREIQEALDPHDLSVKIMQTYANFTVGGSVSVNVHGRYVGQGPLVRSVRSLRVVLADGTLVEASRTVNPEIFAGVVGGYGGLGCHHRRHPRPREERPGEAPPPGDADRGLRPLFHREGAVRLARGLPQRRHLPGRLQHGQRDHLPADGGAGHRARSPGPGGPVLPAESARLLDDVRAARQVGWLRQHVVDPLVLRGEPVSWRNCEASYDVAELEPGSRDDETYVLQEYFVPVERFDDCMPKMRRVFRTHRVNVINVSIRHALPDSVSLLSWAPNEVFAFVVYYKQETDVAAAGEGGHLDPRAGRAGAEPGRLLLPALPAARHPERSSPRPIRRSHEFFALKRRLDPGNKFRNALWNTYDSAGARRASLRS